MLLSKQMSQGVLFGVKLVRKVPNGFLVRLDTTVVPKLTRCDFLCVFPLSIRFVFATYLFSSIAHVRNIRKKSNLLKCLHVADIMSVLLIIHYNFFRLF